MYETTTITNIDLIYQIMMHAIDIQKDNLTRKKGKEWKAGFEPAITERRSHAPTN